MLMPMDYLFSKGQNLNFWPRLGRLVGTKNEPFIIAIFFGKEDPETPVLLNEFAAEVRHLENNGYNYNGVNYEFSIRYYICDAPARAKMKCIIEHGGYFACEKCEVEGEWIDNRMTYVDLEQPLRTDESFSNRAQEDHHNGRSPLDNTHWRPVSLFRLGKLHLVDLGAYKRLLCAWMKWNGPFKLTVPEIQVISEAMEALVPSFPSDFNRKPRTLLEISRYAGTEFRRSLLYDGVLVFRDHLHENVYKNFLLLHSAMYILCSPEHYQNKNALAHALL